MRLGVAMIEQLFLAKTNRLRLNHNQKVLHTTLNLKWKGVIVRYKLYDVGLWPLTCLYRYVMDEQKHLIDGKISK